MNYYIAISDIHGDIDKLNKALLDCDVWIKLQRKIGVIKDEDVIQFVFLGDYIDRMDKPKEVLAKVKEYVLEKNAVCLIGNHDLFLIGTAEGTGIYFEDLGKSASNATMWMNNGGLKTCKQMFGTKLDNYFAELKDLNVTDYIQDILDSDEYKFLTTHGKRKYETELIFFSHSQLSNVKTYDDTVLLWGRNSDYGKPDSAFKVPGNKAMSVHGHFHRIHEGIYFPRITHYVHGGKAKTVVMADCGCGCSSMGKLHPVVIAESPKGVNGITDYVDIIAIL